MMPPHLRHAPPTDRSKTSRRLPRVITPSPWGGRPTL
jgi:hypothetical protein